MFSHITVTAPTAQLDRHAVRVGRAHRIRLRGGEGGARHFDNTTAVTRRSWLHTSPTFDHISVQVTRNTATQGNVGIHRISFANLADEVQCAASILKLASRLDKGLNDTFLDSTAPHKLRKPFV